MLSSSSVAQAALRAAVRRLLSTTATATATATDAAAAATAASSSSRQIPPPLLRLVSRRALQEQQQLHPSPGRLAPKGAHPQNAAASADEKPWPRNVVIGFTVFCSLAGPYVCMWWLSSQAKWREILLGDGDSENDGGTIRSKLLSWMRGHFGEIDQTAISEPELVASVLLQDTRNAIIPHKFVDEPTLNVRQQQAQVQRIWNNPAQLLEVRLYDTSDHTSTTTVQLPAATPANSTAVRTALKWSKDDNNSTPVALDFPVPKQVIVEEPEMETEAKATRPQDDEGVGRPTTGTTNPIPLSIYSLWHHHPDAAAAAPQPTNQKKSSNNNNNNSDARLELARLDHDIALLEHELMNVASTRPIDDIQHDLTQLKQQRRRWKLRQWMRW